MAELIDLVALRAEYIERLRSSVPAFKYVVGVDDVSEDVMGEIIKDLNSPFALVCLSDEVPSSREGEDGFLESDGSASQLLEHDVAVIVGVDAKLDTTRDKSVIGGLVLRQSVKAAYRPPWRPTQAYASNSPRFRGANRVGGFRGIVLYGLYFGQLVYES